MTTGWRTWLAAFLLGVNLVFLTWVGRTSMALWHERQRLGDEARAVEAQTAVSATPRAPRPLPESDPRCVALMNSLGDLSESLAGQGAFAPTEIEALLKAQGCKPPPHPADPPEKGAQ